MNIPPEPGRPLAPATRWLRIARARRVECSVIFTVCVVSAGMMSAVQPAVYWSQALLRIDPPPRLEGEAPWSDTYGKPYDANDPDRQTASGRTAPRLSAPGFVTLAARDAGLIGADEALDQRQAAQWVLSETIPGSGVIVLTVSQPSAPAAHALATAIVARGRAAFLAEQALISARELLAEQLVEADHAVAEAKQALAVESAAPADAQRASKIERAKLELTIVEQRYAAVSARQAELNLVVARPLRMILVQAPTQPLKPSFPRPALNLVAGTGIGLLAAIAFAAVRGSALE